MLSGCGTPSRSGAAAAPMAGDATKASATTSFTPRERMPMFYHDLMRRRVLSDVSGLLLGVVVLTAAVAPRAETPFTWDLPRGFPTPRVPAANPMTVEKVALGRH